MMNWLLIAFTTVFVLSQVTSDPLGRKLIKDQTGSKTAHVGSVKPWLKSFKDKSKRSVEEQSKENDQACIPGIWGCKREVAENEARKNINVETDY